MKHLSCHSGESRNPVIIVITILIIFILPLKAFSEDNPQDYLILEDLGQFKLVRDRTNVYTGKLEPIIPYSKGSGSGILGGTGHWTEDHVDSTYKTDYESVGLDMAVEITITHHCPPPTCTAPTSTPNGLSWLLHEVEDGYRDGDKETLGLLSESSTFRQIDGKNLFFYGGGIVSYTWITSNNIVVDINWSFSEGKPEPLEIVKAYLAKHPSSIPAMTLDKTHSEQWIKDEMERRLWLAEKHALSLESKVWPAKHLVVFLDYREKYYGVKADTEKFILKGITKISDLNPKLKEYKDWFAANKAKPITLSGSFLGKMWSRFTQILPNFFLSKKG